MACEVAGMVGRRIDEIEGDTQSTGSFRQWIVNYIILLCAIFLLLIYEAVMTYVTNHEQKPELF